MEGVFSIQVYYSVWFPFHKHLTMPSFLIEALINLLICFECLNLFQTSEDSNPEMKWTDYYEEFAFSTSGSKSKLNIILWFESSQSSMHKNRMHRHKMYQTISWSWCNIFREWKVHFTIFLFVFMINSRWESTINYNYHARWYWCWEAVI